MAEKAVAPKFFVSDSVREAIRGYYNDPTRGERRNPEALISDMEMTGKYPENLDTALRVALPELQPYYKGVTEEITKLQGISSTLNPTELTYYQGLLTEANKGNPEELQRLKEEFKTDFKRVVGGRFPANQFDSAEQLDSASERAAQHFIVDRGSGTLIDFVARITGKPPSNYAPILNNFQATVGSYVDRGRGAQAGDFGAQLTAATELATQQRKAQAESDRVAAQEALATGQREQSANLFNQAISAFGQALPTFTPEFTAEMLGNIQENVLRQGVTALSNTEAAAQQRGITGSSIEQFGLAQTEGEIMRSLRDATFQFLLQSGQSSQRNREFLANSLMQQSSALLGAGQGTAGLAQQSALTGQQLDLQRTQLASQIAQFNKTFSESQRQFNKQMTFQQKQAGENLALLIQQLSQPRKKQFGSALLGGAGTGAGLGFLVGGPVGAGIGAGIGGLGGGLGELFGG